MSTHRRASTPKELRSKNRLRPRKATFTCIVETLSDQRWGWAALALTATACLSQVPVPDLTQTLNSPDGKSILILLSNQNRMFDGPLRAFTAQSHAELEVFTMTRWGEAALARELGRRDFDLVVTLGSKATWWIAKNAPGQSHLFAMVVNHPRLGLPESQNRMGIAFEPSLAAEFAQFKMVIPDMESVAAFYTTSESASLVGRAEVEWRNLGVELMAVSVRSADEIEGRLQGLIEKVDAVWLLSDPTVVSPESFLMLRDRCLRAKMPLVASLSGTFARRGALMAVSPDLTALGAQAASMATLVLERGVPPHELGVQPPIGSQTLINTSVAAHLGLDIPPDIYPFVELVASPLSQSNIE